MMMLQLVSHTEPNINLPPDTDEDFANAIYAIAVKIHVADLCEWTADRLFQDVANRFVEEQAKVDERYMQLFLWANGFLTDPLRIDVTGKPETLREAIARVLKKGERPEYQEYLPRAYQDFANVGIDLSN